MIPLLKDVLCGFDDIVLIGFSSAESVGVGLYLGLAILQVIGSGGIADLNRRSHTLQKAINSNNLHGARTNATRIMTDLAQLDIALIGFSKSIFYLVLILLLICLIVLSGTTLYPDLVVGCFGAYLILLYFLALPVLIFLISALWIRYKCGAVRLALRDCERLVNTQLMQLSDRSGK